MITQELPTLSAIARQAGVPVHVARYIVRTPAVESGRTERTE